MISFMQEESHSIFLIVFCLLVSAFFSFSETAVTSLTQLRAKHLMDQKGFHYALDLWVKQPGRLLTTILVFNNVVNFLASTVIASLAMRHAPGASIEIATVLTTFLVLVFGEVIPKSFGKLQAERWGFPALVIVAGLYRMTSPLIGLIAGLAEFSLKLFPKSQNLPVITEEEIEFMVHEGEKAGVLKDIKKEIISGAFDFDETTVCEIMTPRTHIAALKIESSVEEFKELVSETGHSRIPVYRDNLDQIVGIVLAKDLIRFENQGKTHLNSLMREAFFIHESQSIMVAFKELKRTKNHMAVIIDEYGGTAGIVTMEDILEQIVGEIQDESDTEVANIVIVAPGIYEVCGTVRLEVFCKFFQIPLPEELKEDIHTLGGWISHFSGQMPRQGLKVCIQKFEMEISEIKGRRIDRVRVIVPPGHVPLVANH